MTVDEEPQSSFSLNTSVETLIREVGRWHIQSITVHLFDVQNTTSMCLHSKPAQDHVGMLMPVTSDRMRVA